MLFNIECENWFWLILSILAVWRLAIMITRDAGPFHIFVALRRLAYSLRLKNLIDCFDCAALWTSFLIVLTFYRLRWTSIVLVVAVAGAASIIQRLVENSPIEESTGEEV